MVLVDVHECISCLLHLEFMIWKHSLLRFQLNVWFYIYNAFPITLSSFPIALFVVLKFEFFLYPKANEFFKNLTFKVESQGYNFMMANYWFGASFLFTPILHLKRLILSKRIKSIHNKVGVKMSFRKKYFFFKRIQFFSIWNS